MVNVTKSLEPAHWPTEWIAGEISPTAAVASRVQANQFKLRLIAASC